jgi:iron complex transport system substrate-binding protein
MIDAILTAAGVENIAAAQGLEGWPPLPLESLVASAPPDLFVTGFFASDAATADQWSPARHPAFARVFATVPTLHLPADVLSCPGFFSVDAAEMIRRAVDRRLGDAR